MNIRVPYNHIGKLDNIEFVSFILDKNQAAIHRIDINRNNNSNFFKKKSEFISVDDTLYKKADTVVFYPFLKHEKCWGKKVTIKTENGEVSKNNGGMEYIKNSDKLGNENDLKKWIKKGLDIGTNQKIRGSKNLVYFSIFGKDYVELFKILIKGLMCQSYKDFDILLITDNQTKKIISKIKLPKSIKFNYLVVNTVKDPVYASMQKIRVFEYKHINDYKKILFLDLDILVIGDLKSVFDKNVYPNKFYSATHKYNKDLHNTSYNTIYDYSEEQINKFEQMNIFPFNAGQFIFLNTSTMENHFNNIKDFIKVWDGKYFFEQSFMNTYFNTLQMSDVFKFRDEFNFVLININDLNYKPTPDSVFVHFIGSVASAKGKIKFIKSNYKHLLPS